MSRIFVWLCVAIVVLGGLSPTAFGETFLQNGNCPNGVCPATAVFSPVRQTVAAAAAIVVRQTNNVQTTRVVTRARLSQRTPLIRGNLIRGGGCGCRGK